MQFVQFPEATTLIGAPRDSVDGDIGGLPAAFGTRLLPSGVVMPCIVSAFKPDYGEIEDIKAGRPIYLHVLSQVMLPVSISTTIEADLVKPN